MSFCNKCGAQLQEGVKFCANCGAPVETTGSTVPTAPGYTHLANTSPYPPAQAATPPLQQQMHYGASPQMSFGQHPSKPKKQKMIIGIVAAIVAIAAIGVIIFLIFGGSHEVVGSWICYDEDYAIIFNSDGTGEVEERIGSGYRQRFTWGSIDSDYIWLELDGYRNTARYETRGGVLFIEGDRLDRVR